MENNIQFVKGVIENRKEWYDDHGRQTVTGKIKLSRATEMYDLGFTGDIHTLSQAALIPRGTRVDYRRIETQAGIFHSVTFKDTATGRTLTTKVTTPCDHRWIREGGICNNRLTEVKR